MRAEIDVSKSMVHITRFAPLKLFYRILYGLLIDHLLQICLWTFNLVFLFFLDSNLYFLVEIKNILKLWCLYTLRLRRGVWTWLIHCYNRWDWLIIFHNLLCNFIITLSIQPNRRNRCLLGRCLSFHHELKLSTLA